MKKVNDLVKMNNYIEKFQLTQYFSAEMRPFMALYEIERNQYICKEKDPLTHFMFFVEGKAKVVQTMSNGKSLLLSFYTPMKVLCDVEFVECLEITCNVQALETCYCIGLETRVCRPILLEDPVFLRFMSGQLGQKLLRLSQNSAINLLYPLETRLASYLVSIATKADSSEIVSEVKCEWFVRENLTQMAELLGTSYRHLHRALLALEENGYLIRENACLYIADISGLRAISDEVYKA